MYKAKSMFCQKFLSNVSTGVRVWLCVRVRARVCVCVCIQPLMSAWLLTLSRRWKQRTLPETMRLSSTISTSSVS